MKKRKITGLRRCLMFVIIQLVIGTSVLGSGVLGQQKVLSVKFKNSTLLNVLEYLSNNSGCVILFNHEQIRDEYKITLEEKDKTIEEILDKCLAKTRFTYKIVDGVYVIVFRTDEKKEQKKKVITGLVIDEEKEPIPGVTVIIKGTAKGVITDAKGKFKLAIPDMKEIKLVFSFIGLETQEVLIKDSLDIKVIMKEAKQALQDVVVTGYANIKKSSFTGNSIRVEKEDILKIASRNIVDVLQVFDPSLRIMKNNEMGSDPNTLPEFYIRGRSGIGIKELDREGISQSALRNNPNTPVFIMDGYEVSVQKVYDFDPNRIESITILKDAAATAIYGSRAANGVIVIETKAPEPGKLQVSYNFEGSLTAPDLSDYNLMNASEKLEAERLAELYESDNVGNYLNLQKEYWKKMNNILKGIDTDWISKPLRNVFNHKHSLYIEGGSKMVRFGLDLKYDNQSGVMKGSSRNRIGTGFYVDYRVRNIQIRNHVTFDVVKAVNSPYGSFSTYTMLMPYDTYKNEDGTLMEVLPSWHSGAGAKSNPLYDAEILKSFDKNGYNDLTNNLSVNWFPTEGLQVKGQFAITKNNSWSEIFTDPDAGKYKNNREDELKGELARTKSEEITWNLNIVANYVKTLFLHNLNLSFGINSRESISSGENSNYKGFPSGSLSSPNYAAEIVTRPGFNDNHTRLFGSFLSLNYTYNDIYLLDASCRMDGSSEFGSKKKFAPFWSAGVGLNLHNYEFMKGQTVLSRLKIRGSYGQTGKTNFPAYAAKHTYDILDDWYSTGNGVFITYLGNDNLKWEKTNAVDIGFDMGVCNDRFTLKFSWYNKKTVDLITDVTLPASTGFQTYKDNLGEVQNRGIELDFRADIFKQKDFNLAIYGNLAHNKNKILKISQSLKAYNDRVDELYEGYDRSQFTKADLKYAKPYMKYAEGGSLTSIWGMKSLGINPADGKEIYLLDDGRITYDWNASDQMILGDKEPDIQGAFGVNLSYRGFSLYASFLYEVGGQIYNQTLVSKVENVDLYESNADKRVLTERWKQFGDITRLKNISDRKEVTRSTSRFVQDNNTINFNSLSIGYDFNTSLIQKIHLSMLRLQFRMKDVCNISSVKQERGTSYPYARTFDFTLSASF